MKALSIRQPWAWLIAAGYKNYENRDRHTNFTGRIYIHAGKSLATKDDQSLALGLWMKASFADDTQAKTVNDFWGATTDQANQGAIIGEVDIVGCDHFELPNMWYYGPHGFRLENALLYDSPIPWKGQLGLFNIDLKGETS